MPKLAPTDESFLASAPKRWERTFEIARPAAEVWAELTSDTPLSWCRALNVRWTSGRPFGVGTTRQARVLGLLAVQERFVVWEEGRRKTFVGESINVPLLNRLAEDYVVEPDGEGACRFTWRIGAEPSLLGKAGAPLNNAIFASAFADTEKHFAAPRGS